MNLTLYKKILTAVLLLLLCLAAAGCGQKSEPEAALPAGFVQIGGQALSPDTTDLTAVMSAGETQQLELLPNLHYADLSGSENVEEISAWAKAHPEVSVRYTVTLPDGTVLPSDTKSVDFSRATGSEALAAAPALSLLPELKTLKLGDERTAMSLDDIGKLRELLPDTVFQYSFDLYGKSCDLSGSTINLFHVPVDDDARRVDQAMALMPQLTYVDMDSCGVSNERMEQLHLKYPDVKIVWRIWFAQGYSVRTDVVKILASKPSVAGMIDDQEAQKLYYCQDVRFLDIGHNAVLKDISFLRGMPKLEVAILAMNNVEDFSPLADCPKLEYLELFHTRLHDLRPLAGLKNLKYLNIAYDFAVRDISPLYELTQLERLWFGRHVPVSPEQIEEMQRCAPNCVINTTANDPTEEGWRDHTAPDGTPGRYSILREQFGYYTDSAFSFSWNDPDYAAGGSEAPESDGKYEFQFVRPT